MSITMQKTLFIFIQTLLVLTKFVASWTPSQDAKYVGSETQASQAEFGNGNLTNFFKVLDQDDYSILVGAR